ncbi:peptidase S41 [Bacteroidia bacterium]|nr:peptidase S41 [Bacteroidia bacterium]
MENKRKILSKLVLPLTLLCVLALGVLIGVRVSKHNIQQDFLMMQRWNKMNAVLSIIGKEYVDTVDNTALEEQTITHVLKTLDPHSVYIPASQMKGANEELDGTFEGIGIMFNMLTDTAQVINTIAGGPSQRVGVWAGDKIITVNDSIIAGRKVPQDSIVRLLRGKRGSQVTIGVSRTGESQLIPFTIERGNIPIKSVEAAYMLTPQIGFIKLSKFSRTTYDEVIESVQQLQTGGMESLVLDLRGNGGGFLDQAFDVLDEFFEKGVLLVYTEGRARARQNLVATSNGALKGTPVAVLIDEGSASASEIVAGAIQDNDRGWVIGRRSFGKALVQEPINFSDRSGIRLTVARYYTPTGRCIQRPYSDGETEYYKDIQRRYEHGEFSASDSIVQNKDQQYKTPKGKIVYGGGGITPDIFVPVDTSGVNDFFQSVYRKNLIYKFALQFTDNNRAALRKIETLAQLKRYLYYRNLAPAFATYAAQQGITANERQLKECTPLLNAQIKALIGRTTKLDDIGFYVFLNPIDNTVQTAIKTLKNNKL